MMLILAHGDGHIFGPFSGWTFFLRFAEQLLQVTPQLLTGVLLAGLLRTRFGHAFLLGCFDGGPGRGMLRALVLGFLTPVGALGALPIATEMLRARVRTSAVLCFLVTAPLFMPWSFGYAADAVGLANAVLILLSGVLVAMATGVTASWLGDPASAARQPDSLSGRHQLVGALRVAAGHCAGWTLAYALLALAASAAFAAVLEPGAIEAHLGEQSSVTLLELSVPIALASLEPDIAVALAGEFWRIGLLAGGMFIVFHLGAAWSVGALAWCVHHLRSRAVPVLLTWLVMATGLALAANSLLAPVRPGEADSHAFDMLTKPYNFGGSSPAEGVAAQLRRAADGNEPACAALLLLLIVGGIDRWRLRTRPAETAVADPSIEPSRASAALVRAILSGGLVLWLVAGVYSYFPPPAELHERMRQRSGDLYEATVVMNAPQRSAAARDAARDRALNALDRMDDALERYTYAHAIRLASATSLDVAGCRAATHQLRSLILGDAPEALKPAALELAQRLAAD